VVCVVGHASPAVCGYGREAFLPYATCDGVGGMRVERLRRCEGWRGAGGEPIGRPIARLAERMDQDAVTMSGGEQQMLAIARAMIAKPDLIMLDEPSEGIMPVLVDEMFELFRSMKAQGTTVLLVEQNVELALGIADRAYVLDQGAVVHQASARALLADDEIKERYCSV